MGTFSSRLFLFVTALSCSILLSAPAKATQTGRFGAYQFGCGGGGCHGQGGTTVSLNGPRTVDAGSTADYTFTIAHGNNNYAGFNVAFLTNQGGYAGTLTAGDGSKLGTGELTHTGPKQGAGGTTSFPFQWTAPQQHGTYTFYGAGNAVNNGGTPDGDAYNTSGAITISVPGATITAPSFGAGYCIGATITINWTQTAITNLRIEMSANDFANTIMINNNIAGTAGTYSYTIPAGTAANNAYVIRLVNSANGNELTRVSPIAISGGATITTQPTTQDVCEGKQLQLMVAATGSNITYQWRKGGQAIPGGNTAIYTVFSATTFDAGTYDCQVTSCGQTVTSNQATITLINKPTVTGQPSARTVCEGDSVSFTVSATGTGLTYQWLLEGISIPGATNATYKIASTVPGSEGLYRCRLSGTCTPQALSDTVRLVVLEHPAVSGQPADKTLTAGDTLKLSVTAAGEAISFQWKRNGTDIPGATVKDYIKNGVARSDSGKYRCTIWNQCDTVQSREANVKINAAAGPGVLALSVSSLEVGDVMLCADHDTTIVGLLANDGGSPITVTSAATDPPAVISLVGFAAPLTIPASGAATVAINIKPSALGAISGTISFLSSGGNKTLSVNGTATNAIAMNKDTITFMGTTGEKICMTSAPLLCPTVIVQSVTISGSGSSTFKVSSDLTLPHTVNENGTFDVCVESVTNEAAEAQVDVVTTGGTVSAKLIRVPASSVDEDDVVFAGMTISPNPANEFIRVNAPTTQNLSVRVMSITGQTVSVLKGTDSVLWRLHDGNGQRVSPGLYILQIEDGGKNSIAKVLVY